MEVQRRYGDRSLAVVGVTEASADEACAFARENDLEFPILAEAGDVQEAYGIDAIWGSVVFLIDPDGRVVADSLAAAEAALSER